jgi:hypothetical protein
MALLQTLAERGAGISAAATLSTMPDRRPEDSGHAARAIRQFGSGSRIPVQRHGRRLPKGDAIGHRKAPELQEMMVAGDLGNTRCRRIGSP